MSCAIDSPQTTFLGLFFFYKEILLGVERTNKKEKENWENWEKMVETILDSKSVAKCLLCLFPWIWH